MAKTEEQIKEEFLFIVENNKELLENVIASYNNFLAEYRKFLEKDYATLTIYEAIESAESYALEKDEEEGGTFYAELLTDWYDEQVLEWKKRLDGLKNDYMMRVFQSLIQKITWIGAITSVQSSMILQIGAS